MSEIIPFRRPTRQQDLVLRFLTSVGHKRDAEFYLNLFTAIRPESFAIIVLDADVLQDEMDSVLFEVRYLMRLNLYPVVLFRTTSQRLKDLDIESYFKKAKIVFHILSEEYTDAEKLEFIRERIKKKMLPLLHLEPVRDVVSEVSRLAKILRTAKIIFLKKSGGIVRQDDQSPISIINLRFDRDKILKEGVLGPGDVQLLNMCDRLIRGCDHKIYVSIVSPNDLLRELFTVKGAGTLVQMGSKINRYADWDSIDPRSLKRLMEMSFERKFRDEFFKEKFDNFYIEENYMGAALLKKYKDMFYLSKFAVGTEARGLGIGRDIWNEIVRNHKKIFWRSDPKKFITHWYIKQCDGMHRDSRWTIFWKGISPRDIQHAIAYARKQRVDYKE